MKKTAWYYAKGDQQQGPVAWEKLCAMAVSGELSRDDLVWSDGASDWYPAGQAEGLTFAEGVSSGNAQQTDANPPKAPVESAAEAPSPDEEHSSDQSAAEKPPPEQQTPREAPEIEERGDLTGISFADSVRVAIDDARMAFQILIVNPTGQISEVYRQLGPLRGMMVGAVFAAVYFVCFVLGSGATLGFLLSLLGGVLTPLTLWGGVWAVRSIGHARGDYKTDIFLVGCALLPLGFATLIGGILGPAQLGLPVFLETFALCYAALILFRGFSSLFGLSEKVAMLAAPVVLAANYWIVSQVVLVLGTVAS